MEITFTYIRNRIREHSKQELLHACYNILDDKKDEIKKPIWFVFLLMKWTYLYGGEKYPSKPLTQKKLSNILKSITDFNQIGRNSQSVSHTLFSTILFTNFRI